MIYVTYKNVTYKVSADIKNRLTRWDAIDCGCGAYRNERTTLHAELVGIITESAVLKGNPENFSHYHLREYNGN